MLLYFLFALTLVDHTASAHGSCDSLRSECCGLLRDQNIQPGWSWGDADEVQKKWWTANKCDYRTTDCPYSCSSCDEVREKCCTFPSKYGLIPGVTWKYTPWSQQKWYSENNCDDYMASCPYECRYDDMTCDEWKKGACERYEDVKKVVSLGEFINESDCQKRCEASAPLHGPGCCQWGDRYSVTWEGNTECLYFKNLKDDGDGTRYKWGKNKRRRVCSYDTESKGGLAMSQPSGPKTFTVVKVFAAFGLVTTLYTAFRYYSQK